MQRLLLLAAIGSVVLGSVAHARDTEYRLPVAEAIQDAEVRKNLGTDVAFYFSGQPNPPVAKSFGEFVTNKKTNSVGRPDLVACRWAMLSALLQLRDRARQLGADAVINIVSYYKKETTASATDYVCHAGAVVAGVALKGTFVKTK
ncbi:MAG: excinuclease ATPase subunit [Proteobacteria bacterium]|nr:excinuclease ATPase subunit [Pseudomonadota bacterium]